MALLDDVKVALRVTTDAMDTEIGMLIDAAIADMRRVHVREELLDEDDMAPLVKMAVILFCKSHFGYDNDEAERFDESYRQLVADFLNSPTSYMRSSEDSEDEEEGEVEEEEGSEETETEAEDEETSEEGSETEDETEVDDDAVE